MRHPKRDRGTSKVLIIVFIFVFGLAIVGAKLGIIGSPDTPRAQPQASLPAPATQNAQIQGDNSNCVNKSYTPASMFEQNPADSGALSMDWTSPRTKALMEIAANGQYSTIGYVTTKSGCFMQILVDGQYKGTGYRAKVYIIERPAS